MHAYAPLPQLFSAPLASDGGAQARYRTQTPEERPEPRYAREAMVLGVHCRTPTRPERKGYRARGGRAVHTGLGESTRMGTERWKNSPPVADPVGVHIMIEACFPMELGIRCWCGDDVQALTLMGATEGAHTEGVVTIYVGARLGGCIRVG
jgi:hypothetical protein